MKPSMMPVKQYLTINEACEYLSVCRKTFWKIRKENSLTQYFFAGKEYFKVSELNKLIESSVIIKQRA